MRLRKAIKSGIVSLILIVLGGVLLPASVLGCSVNIPPLRKDFRWADRIFVGEVVDIADRPVGSVNTQQKPVFGIVRFKVHKAWKGQTATEISLPSDVGGSLCPDDFDYFKKGEKYLVFAKKNYAPYVMATKFQWADAKMCRLDNLWFRTWARIFPF